MIIDENISGQPIMKSAIEPNQDYWEMLDKLMLLFERSVILLILYVLVYATPRDIQLTEPGHSDSNSDVENNTNHESTLEETFYQRHALGNH